MEVVYDDRAAGTGEMPGDRRAHGAETDYADPLPPGCLVLRHHDCASI
jgi:hypothetical protein